MADRSHVKESIPCKNPGCGGFLKCEGGSKLIQFNGGIARVRLRTCERCHRKIETTEFESRVINSGRVIREKLEVLPATRQLPLF